MNNKIFFSSIAKRTFVSKRTFVCNHLWKGNDFKKYM